MAICTSKPQNGQKAVKKHQKNSQYESHTVIQVFRSHIRAFCVQIPFVFADIGALRCFTQDLTSVNLKAVGSHVSHDHKEPICTSSFWKLTVPGYCLFCCMEKEQLGNFAKCLRFYIIHRKENHTDLFDYFAPLKSLRRFTLGNL